MGLREGDSASRDWRSKSNHRCCFNSRFRNKETRYATDSVFSSSSSSISQRKRSSTSEKASSGYGCSNPKRPRIPARSKRRKHSSHVSLPNCNHTTGTCKAKRISGDEGRPRDHSSSSSRSRVTRSHAGKHPDHPIKRERQRSSSIDGHSRHGQLRNGRFPGSPRLPDRDNKQVARRKREEKRRDEKARRKVSHERHKRKPSTIVPVGEVIKRRFRVEKILGEGSYGQVFECFDLYTNSLTAVKALKPQSGYNDAARHELEVLESIARLDAKNRSHCISSIDFFEWHDHFYIVFPLLGPSVFTFLEENGYEPYPIEQCAIITRQICEAVAFLHRIKLTHTDLKPENILFVDGSYDEVFDNHRGKTVRRIRHPYIKIIDFGSATFDNDHHSTTIQTRHYRAPEVVMELGWNRSADVWSVGCILYELVTGRCLFMTHDNLEHLAMMERVLGTLPKCMTKASRRRRYFRHGRLDWSPTSSESRYVRRALKPLGDYWFSSFDRYKRLAFDLVKEMLMYIPTERITCSKALEHPFILSFHT
ncbi:unnamed protein product [Trichobilharzia szidati]|nr:unnamed protein product [Trichobilharzia szidati]